MSHLQRLQAALVSRDVDGTIISSAINQHYLSGFRYSDGYLLVTQQRAYLLADFRYIEAARNAVTEFEVVRPEGSMLDELKQIVDREQLRRIAIEEASLSCADYQRLAEKLGSSTLCTGASEMLSRLRTVKTPEELQKIARAQEITDLAFSHILSFISPNVTERELALELEFFMRKNGAEGVAFQTIAVSGSASSLPHGVPSDVKLRPGFLTMDFGAKVDGYCSDMTRTVVLGKADADMKMLYNTVLSAQLAALEQLHEGMRCRDADEIARSIIRDAGYGACFGHSLGHGVGLYIHEAPSLSARSAEAVVLERGNVVTVEPGIYLEGKYGCRIEDMVAIDHDGSLLNFTKSPKELIEI